VLPFEGNTLAWHALGDPKSPARLSAQHHGEGIVTPEAEPTGVLLQRGPHEVTWLPNDDGVLVNVRKIELCHAATVSPRQWGPQSRWWR
jgi:hypothetical protein